MVKLILTLIIQKLLIIENLKQSGQNTEAVISNLHSGRSKQLIDILSPLQLKPSLMHTAPKPHCVPFRSEGVHAARVSTNGQPV